MDYKKILEKYGFIEGKDFSLTENSFIMLEQSMMIQSVINHPAIEATYDEEGNELTPYIPAYDEPEFITHPEVPAVLDEQGNEITPAIPAWQEPKMVEEFFTLTAPEQGVLEEMWKHIQLEENDIVLLINKFLEGKDHLRTEEDSINIVNGHIYTWDYKNISQPTVDELLALIPIVTEEQIKKNEIETRAARGKKFREDCDKCLDIIADFNDQRSLTVAQIQQMQTTFAPINQALNSRMPKTAKALLINVVADGVIVTDEMKNMVLDVLKEYPLV